MVELLGGIEPARSLILAAMEELLALGVSAVGVDAADREVLRAHDAPGRGRVGEDDDVAGRPIDREQMRIIQTPQTFRSEIILPAFEQEHQPSFTDEATVVEAYGDVVYLTEGERSNIKVTTPEDMIVAEALLKARDNA